MNGTLYTILIGIENFLQDRIDLLAGKFYFGKIDDTAQYYDPRPENQTQPIMNLLYVIGRENRVDMSRVTMPFLEQCTYEFLDLYDQGGKAALLHRLQKIRTMDNLDRLRVMKLVKQCAELGKPVSIPGRQKVKFRT